MPRFKRNPNFETELTAQPKFQAGLRTKAGEARIAIYQVAPRASGAYRRSWSARGNLVITTDAFWHLIEFGSVNNVPYAPIRRGVRAAGMRLQEITKTQ